MATNNYLPHYSKALGFSEASISEKPILAFVAVGEHKTIWEKMMALMAIPPPPQ